MILSLGGNLLPEVDGEGDQVGKSFGVHGGLQWVAASTAAKC